jgi:hypothetical protein
MSSIRRTNGCDHAQSEHFQSADSFAGHKIFRVVSVIPQLYAHLHQSSREEA